MGLVFGAVFTIGMASLALAAGAPRQMENLGRGELGIVAWGSQMTSSQDK